jgi:hypothetical protein
MKLVLFIFAFNFTTSLLAAPANVFLGFDCSKKSFQGDFGKNTYGSSLYLPEAAFDRAKGDSDQLHGPTKQSPMLWALRVLLPTLPKYSFSLYDNLYGLSSAEGFEQDLVLNFATYAESAPEETAISYVESSIKEIKDKEDIGPDFNPLPFMHHIINQLDKQEKPSLISAIVFSSGDVEDRLREKIRDLIVDSSYLPIKWIFIIVGRDNESNEIANIIKESKSHHKLFDNAISIPIDRYFDFDGIGEWTKFDISDSLKTSTTKKFETDIAAFIHKDYEGKVLKLIKARETIISCREKADSLVKY